MKLSRGVAAGWLAARLIQFAFLGISFLTSLGGARPTGHSCRMRTPFQPKWRLATASRLAALPLLAYALVPDTALGMQSAELYYTQAYFYGRFEARIRYAPGDGVVSSFFLWKDGSSSTTYWNELDMEKVGADCEMRTNAYYGLPAVQHTQNNSSSMPASICADYHDYRYEWTPTYIAWAIDGNEFRRDTGDTATAFSQNASGGMTIHFNIWPGNSDFGGNIANTTLPVHQYISWVQYSSYSNGAFQLQWREEFQTSGLPSGWAVGNWSSVYNLFNPQSAERQLRQRHCRAVFDRRQRYGQPGHATH